MRFLIFMLLCVTRLYPAIEQSVLSSEVLLPYLELIDNELYKEFMHQDDGRTFRATREYGYSFFKMEQNDFTYTPPPEFLQELGNHICRALGDEPPIFTNIILSYYGEGFHLEPHVDVGYKDRYGDCPFYFGEKVYGIVIEADQKGHLHFVKWDEGLSPPLDLEPIYTLEEEDGLVFCLQGELRKSPYFHGVSPIANRRISITFREVIRTDH